MIARIILMRNGNAIYIAITRNLLKFCTYRSYELAVNITGHVLSGTRLFLSIHQFLLARPNDISRTKTAMLKTVPGTKSQQTPPLLGWILNILDSYLQHEEKILLIKLGYVNTWRYY